jgi:antitoxin component YwqK of YwqJK toxin-antitoxin module
VYIFIHVNNKYLNLFAKAKKITPMKRTIVLSYLIFLISINTQAQPDTLFNQVDAAGQKQGFWKKSYPNGNLLYKGEFKDNKPIGKMLRYYESGGLQASLAFGPDGYTAKAKLFYEDGELSAEGNYFQMQKDSVWRYYSFYSTALVSEESWLKGKKHGDFISYYENGQVSEIIEWQHDIKEGRWIQYFADGTEKMKCGHNFNMVNGRYYFYYDNGLLMILGNFVDDKRHGPWVFYDDSGKEKHTIEYDFGKALNAEELIKSDEEYFQFIEENIGKFEDPSLEDFFPGSGGY